MIRIPTSLQRRTQSGGDPDAMKASEMEYRRRLYHERNVVVIPLDELNSDFEIQYGKNIGNRLYGKRRSDNA